VEFYVHSLESPNSSAKVLFALTASHGTVMLTDSVQTLAFQQTGHIQWIFLGGTEELSMGTGKVVVTGSAPISLGYAYYLAISSSIDLLYALNEKV